MNYQKVDAFTQPYLIAPPLYKREDYAKWDLVEPAVNFSISKRGHTKGISDLSIQVDSENTLEEIPQRLDNTATNLRQDTSKIND